MHLIPWGGANLKRRSEVFWKVTIWDEKDEAETSDTAHFELGLLEKNDWSAEWITGDYVPKKKERYPVDCFKRSFVVKDTIPNATYSFYIQARKGSSYSVITGTLDFSSGSAPSTRSINEDHNDQDDSSVSITYANNTLYIQGIPVYALQIYEASSGKLVMNLTKQKADKVDLSVLEKGIYIVNVVYNGEVVTRKIVR